VHHQWPPHSIPLQENIMTTMTDDQLARQETSTLISSEKVGGTAVYNQAGEKLGTIHHLMIGKRDGCVRYAVMSFGGLFGIGEQYHPLPWKTLTYDEDKEGYSVDLSVEQLRGGPSFRSDQEPSYDRPYGDRVYGYYGMTYF